MPSTKVECDRKIADLQGQLERAKADLANIKAQTAAMRKAGKNWSCTGAVASLNGRIASIKAEIARIRAHKKECKS